MRPLIERVSECDAELPLPGGVVVAVMSILAGVATWARCSRPKAVSAPAGNSHTPSRAVKGFAP